MEIDSCYILCPYCKSKCGDYEDFEDDELFNEDEKEFECPECEKKFLGKRCVTIDYRTEGDCSMNNESHIFGKYQCKNCDVYKGEEDLKQQEKDE